MTEAAATTPPLDTATSPDYASLKCPKCGNTRFFREIAMRETEQTFRVDGGEPHFDPYEEFDVIEVIEIRCFADRTSPEDERGLACDEVVRSYE